MAECYELGANGYVVKPVDFNDFFDAVKALGKFWAVVNEHPHTTVRRTSMQSQVESRYWQPQGEIRILHLEDSAPDIELVKEWLSDAGMPLRRCSMLSIVSSKR